LQILHTILVNSVQNSMHFLMPIFPFYNYQWHCCMMLFATLVYLLSFTSFVVLCCVHLYVLKNFGVVLLYYFYTDALRWPWQTSVRTKSNIYSWTKSAKIVTLSVPPC